MATRPSPQKRSFARGCRRGNSRCWPGLKGRKAQGSQATIQQSLIDINVVRQQLPKGAPKIGQISLPVKGFKQTDAAQNLEALCFRQLARPVIVDQQKARTEFFSQEDCAHLPWTQTISLLGREQVGRPPKPFYFNPFCFRNLRCSRQPSASDDNFMVNFSGDVEARKKPMQEVKTAKLGQNNQGR